MGVWFRISLWVRLWFLPLLYAGCFPLRCGCWWILDLESPPQCAVQNLISSKGKTSGNGNGKETAKCREEIKLESSAYWVATRSHPVDCWWCYFTPDGLLPREVFVRSFASSHQVEMRLNTCSVVMKHFKQPAPQKVITTKPWNSWLYQIVVFYCREAFTKAKQSCQHLRD